MKNLKHFIWDFDGTLFDTYPKIIEAFQHALRDFGADASENEIMQRMLVSIPSTIEYYAREHSLGNELMVRYLSYSSDAALASSPPFPYIKDALRYIVENGGKNYIFTHRNNGVYGFLSAHDMLSYFTEIVNEDSECFERKPSSKPILYLLDKYQMDPREAIMIGDRKIDLDAGMGAGIRTCHFINAKIPQYFDCDMEIHGFDELIERLKIEKES